MSVHAKSVRRQRRHAPRSARTWATMHISWRRGRRSSAGGSAMLLGMLPQSMVMVMRALMACISRRCRPSLACLYQLLLYQLLLCPLLLCPLQQHQRTSLGSLSDWQRSKRRAFSTKTNSKPPRRCSSKSQRHRRHRRRRILRRRQIRRHRRNHRRRHQLSHSHSRHQLSHRRSRGRPRSARQPSTSSARGAHQTSATMCSSCRRSSRLRIARVWPRLPKASASRKGAGSGAGGCRGRGGGGRTPRAYHERMGGAA